MKVLEGSRFRKPHLGFLLLRVSVKVYLTLPVALRFETIGSFSAPL